MDESCSAASSHSSPAVFAPAAAEWDGAPGSRRARDRVRQKARLADDIVPARVPGFGDGVEHLAEGGQPVAGAVGEVRAGRRTGSPSGVAKTLIGHPPRPVAACTASM